MTLDKVLRCYFVITEEWSFFFCVSAWTKWPLNQPQEPLHLPRGSISLVQANLPRVHPCRRLRWGWREFRVVLECKQTRSSTLRTSRNLWLLQQWTLGWWSKALQSTTILRTSSDKTFAFRSRSPVCGNQNETTSAATMTVKIWLDSWTWKTSLKDSVYKLFWFVLTLFSPYQWCTYLLEWIKSKRHQTNIMFLQKAWALPPKAASIGGCLAFVVSLDLTRAPEDTKGVTNSSTFGFISFLLEPHVHLSPEWADFLYQSKRHRWPQDLLFCWWCLAKGSLDHAISKGRGGSVHSLGRNECFYNCVYNVSGDYCLSFILWYMIHWGKIS